MPVSLPPTAQSPDFKNSLPFLPARRKSAHNGKRFSSSKGHANHKEESSLRLTIHQNKGVGIKAKRGQALSIHKSHLIPICLQKDRKYDLRFVSPEKGINSSKPPASTGTWKVAFKTCTGRTLVRFLVSFDFSSCLITSTRDRL